MRITHYRGTVLLAGSVLAAMGLIGCSNAPAQPETSKGPLTTAAPTTQPAGPPPDTGGGGGGGAGGVALNLASLPIGGGFEDSSAPTCVVVNWIPKQTADELPAGVRVTVTAAGFDPQAWEPVDSGCSGAQPSCVGFSFEAGHTACGVGVRPSGIASASQSGQAELTLAGTVVCVDPSDAACVSFFNSVQSDNGSTIQVDVPPSTGTPTP